MKGKGEYETLAQHPAGFKPSTSRLEGRALATVLKLIWLHLDFGQV